MILNLEIQLIILHFGSSSGCLIGCLIGCYIGCSAVSLAVQLAARLYSAFSFNNSTIQQFNNSTICFLAVSFNNSTIRQLLVPPIVLPHKPFRRQQEDDNKEQPFEIEER